MIKPLLADRFKLQFYEETRQTQGYNLVISKSGSKLKEAVAGQRPKPPAQQSPGANPGKASAPAGEGIMFGQLTTAGITGNLALRLHVPIVDNTRLTGRYNVELHWTSDEFAGEPGTDRAPSLFTALQEQLGLRLEPAKLPRPRHRLR